MLQLLPVTAAAYLIGAIPAGWIAVRLIKKEDLRFHGSGSVGATNVFRLLGFKWALPVMLFDFFKGFLPVYLIISGVIDAGVPSAYAAVSAGLAAVAGHVYPVYLGYRGGKGVATGAGFLSALYPPVIPVCLGVFAAVILITRRVSPGSIAASIAAPISCIYFMRYYQQPYEPVIIAVYLLLPLFVFYTHRENISRLLSGNEPPLF